MTNSNFDIDKLINSAREEKTVFSMDDARNLFENSEAIFGEREMQRKKTRGVILMNMIASVIVAAAAVGYLSVSGGNVPDGNRNTSAQSTIRQNNATQSTESNSGISNGRMDPQRPIASKKQITAKADKNKLTVSNKQATLYNRYEPVNVQLQTTQAINPGSTTVNNAMQNVNTTLAIAVNSGDINNDKVGTSNNEEAVPDYFQNSNVKTTLYSSTALNDAPVNVDQKINSSLTAVNDAVRNVNATLARNDYTPDKNLKISIRNGADFKSSEDMNVPVLKFDQVNVKGVRMVEADEETLNRLGIHVDPNGRFIAVKLTKQSTEPSVIYVDWGMGWSSSNKFPNNNSETPSLITDMYGNRRVMTYENDDIQRVATQDMSQTQSKTADGKIVKRIENKISINVQNNSNSEAANIPNMPDIPNLPNISDMPDVTISTGINGTGTFMDKDGTNHIVVNGDTIIINKDFNSLFSQYPDSCAKFELYFQANKCDSILKNFDKMKSFKNFRMKIMSSKNAIGDKMMMNNPNFSWVFDSSMASGVRADNIADIDIKSITNDAMNTTAFTMNFDFDKLIEINKLIPVKVKVPGAKDRNGNLIKDFSFILWYKPTDLFINELPTSVKNELKPEVAVVNSTNDYCEKSTIAGKDTYFDIWRSCSGSIENLRTYPNPATNNVNVNFKLGEARQLTISLHDLSGKHIMTFADGMYLPAGETTRSFDITNLESGMYLVVVSSDCGEHAVQRIIKQ